MPTVSEKTADGSRGRSIMTDACRDAVQRVLDLARGFVQGERGQREIDPDDPNLGLGDPPKKKTAKRKGAASRPGRPPAKKAAKKKAPAPKKKGAKKKTAGKKKAARK